jgi:hypothetical protein
LAHWKTETSPKAEHDAAPADLLDRVADFEGQGGKHDR